MVRGHVDNVGPSRMHKTTYPMEIVHGDVLTLLPGPLDKATMRHALVFVDRFSSLVAAMPIPNLYVSSICIAIEKIFSTLPSPTHVITDNASILANHKLVRDTFRSLGTTSFSTSSPYNSRGNSPVESSNNLIRKLLQLVNETFRTTKFWRNFFLCLKQVNNRLLTRLSKKAGDIVTPESLMFNRRPNINILDQILEPISPSDSKRYKLKYSRLMEEFDQSEQRKIDEARKKFKPSFELKKGEIVLLRNHLHIKSKNPIFYRDLYEILEVYRGKVKIKSMFTSEKKPRFVSKNDVKLFRTHPIINTMIPERLLSFLGHGYRKTDLKKKGQKAPTIVSERLIREPMQLRYRITPQEGINSRPALLEEESLCPQDSLTTISARTPKRGVNVGQDDAPVEITMPSLPPMPPPLNANIPIACDSDGEDVSFDDEEIQFEPDDEVEEKEEALPNDEEELDDAVETQQDDKRRADKSPQQSPPKTSPVLSGPPPRPEKADTPKRSISIALPESTKIFPVKPKLCEDKPIKPLDQAQFLKKLEEAAEEQAKYEAQKAKQALARKEQVIKTSTDKKPAVTQKVVPSGRENTNPFLPSGTTPKAVKGGAPLAASSPEGAPPAVSPANEPNVMTPLRDSRRRSGRLSASPNVLGSFYEQPSSDEDFEGFKTLPVADSTPERFAQKLKSLEESTGQKPKTPTPEKLRRRMQKLTMDDEKEQEQQKSSNPAQNRPTRTKKKPKRFGYDEFT